MKLRPAVEVSRADPSSNAAARLVTWSLAALTTLVFLGAFVPSWELPRWLGWLFADLLSRAEGTPLLAAMALSAIAGASAIAARARLPRTVYVTIAGISGALPVVMVTAAALGVVIDGAGSRYLLALGLVIAPVGLWLRRDRADAALGRWLAGLGAIAIAIACMGAFTVPGAVVDVDTLDRGRVAFEHPGRGAALSIMGVLRAGALIAAACALFGALSPERRSIRRAQRLAAAALVAWPAVALIAARVVLTGAAPRVATTPLQEYSEYLYEPALVILLISLLATRGLASLLGETPPATTPATKT